MVACEGLDARIVDLVRARGSAVPELPRGAGWLFVEVVGAEAPGAGREGRRRGRRAGPPAGDRRRRGGRAVADPRGRRRPGRPQPEDAGVLRLGGRRGPAGPAGRLAARLRRAAEGARPRRGALRPLRRRLRARADRLPVRAGPGRVGEGVPRLPHRLRAQAARPPRLALRRARRRPGPLRAAPADVRRGVAPALRRGQGDLRPAQPAQPRQPGRPGAAGRRPAAGPGPPAGAAAAEAPARRWPARRRGAPLHRRRQVRRGRRPPA